MATIGKAVHERLSSHAGVSGEVGNAIYPHRLPQGVRRGIVYSLVSAPKESVMGRDTDSHPRIEIISWAETHADAVAAAEEAKNALQRFNGTVTAGGTDYEIKATFVEAELDRFDDDTELEGRQVDFRMTHGE